MLVRANVEEFDNDEKRVILKHFGYSRCDRHNKEVWKKATCLPKRYGEFSMGLKAAWKQLKRYIKSTAKEWYGD
jgi:hypothetical protein